MYDENTKIDCYKYSNYNPWLSMLSGFGITIGPPDGYENCGLTYGVNRRCRWREGEEREIERLWRKVTRRGSVRLNDGLGIEPESTEAAK